VSGQVVNLAVPVVGFALASRRPANRIGWLFLTAGLVLALDAFGTLGNSSRRWLSGIARRLALP
jgi:hypothetical protein